VTTAFSACRRSCSAGTWKYTRHVPANLPAIILLSLSPAVRWVGLLRTSFCHNDSSVVVKDLDLKDEVKDKALRFKDKDKDL